MLMPMDLLVSAAAMSELYLQTSWTVALPPLSKGASSHSFHGLYNWLTTYRAWTCHQCFPRWFLPSGKSSVTDPLLHIEGFLVISFLTEVFYSQAIFGCSFPILDIKLIFFFSALPTIHLWDIEDKCHLRAMPSLLCKLPAKQFIYTLACGWVHM